MIMIIKRDVEVVRGLVKDIGACWQKSKEWKVTSLLVYIFSR